MAQPRFMAQGSWFLVLFGVQGSWFKVQGAAPGTLNVELEHQEQNRGTRNHAP